MPRLVTRDDWDAFHAKGSCPTPPPPRKWNYLPLVATGPIHNTITLVLWLPMGLVVFALSLALNLSAWLITYTCLGGAHGLGLRSTLPKSNVILRWVMSLIDVFNVVEIPKAWEPAKAVIAFEAFRARNGFTEDELMIQTRTIGDDVTKPEVVHKYHKLDAHPAKLHVLYVLCAPSRTFLASSTSFTLDGTSCFNLVKGFVHTYYEDGKAPLVRPRAGRAELDLQLDQDMKAQLDAWTALRVCVWTSWTMGLCYGRWILSREVFDLLACASPTVCAAIETIGLEENAKLTQEVSARGMKMFAYVMSCSAQASKQVCPAVERPILLTQISCQSRFYTPKVERSVVGNWLIGLGARPSLDDMGDEQWASTYYAELVGQMGSFSGGTAWSFLNQVVYGVLGTGFWANPRIIYWFNNYGLRTMHPAAGGVTYHWGPNYGVATYLLVNVVTVDGRQCITLLSSVIPQGRLQEIATLMKRLMVEQAAEGPQAAHGATASAAPDPDGTTLL